MRWFALLSLFPALLAAQSPIRIPYITPRGDTVLAEVAVTLTAAVQPRVDTVRKTDTLWRTDTLRLPALSPVVGTDVAAGVAFGPWHLPSEQYANTPYTGAYLGYQTVVSASTPSGFIAQIAEAKAAGRRLMLNLVPRVKSSSGGPDMAYYLRVLDAWKPYASQLKAYADSGTVIGVMLADEPNCGSCWGGRAWTTSQLQQVAQAAQELLPTIPRGFRATPGWLKSRNSPALLRALDFAWFQYEGPLHLPCAKAIDLCIQKQSDTAKSIGLRLVAGLNTLDGGDGSSGVPGTYDLASVKTRWQLSAAEVLKYGTALVTDPRVCAVLSWRFGGNADKNQINSRMTDQQLRDILSFDTRMRSQFDSVAKIARAQPARSCAKS